MAISNETVNRLHDTGFVEFNLKDLDSSLYTKLWNEVGDGPHTLQHNIKLVRAKWLQKWDGELNEDWLFGNDVHTIEHFTRTEYDTDVHIIEITVRYEDIQECINFTERVHSIDKIELQELWCFQNGLPVTEIRQSVFDIFSKIIDTFYSKILDTENSIYELTWYRKNGIIYSHRDVWDGNLPDPVKLCSILLYLNKNYDESEQGQIYVDNEKYVVYPKFGNVALLDYHNHALEHRVEPPTSDYGRYGVLSFIDLNKVKNKSSLF